MLSSLAQLTSAAAALTYHLMPWQSAGVSCWRGFMAIDVTVTERAARKIGEILGREPSGTMLRVSVQGGGCSGFQYKFDTERAKADDDVVIERAGATVLIDPVSLDYMAGSEIDFVDDLIGSSFKVHNPKATASCGCGTSFAL
jgi:iron-sulfur cluster assembly accessory protein